MGRKSAGKRSAHTPERAHLSKGQFDAILRCYAERRSPKDAAEISGVSCNTIYLHYNRIRWRLILTRYYENGALRYNDPGLSPEVREQLRLRRGIREDEIYPHAAELIDWAEQWPPKLVVKHIHKLIALSGPLDQPPDLSEPEIDRLQAYVRYACRELIYDRRKSSPIQDEAQAAQIERAEEAVNEAWRTYRAACKHLERYPEQVTRPTRSRKRALSVKIDRKTLRTK